MKNRLSGKLNNTIELTSLLDVIFIVLMIVICNQKLNMTQKTADTDMLNKAAEIRMEQANDELAAVEAEKELFKQHKETYDGLQDSLEVITVYVDYKPSNIKNREIRMMAGDKELKKITISPSNTENAYGEFEDELEKEIFAAEKEKKPVIISIDTTRILYRDEKAVDEIINRLFKKHKNLFSKKSGN